MKVKAKVKAVKAVKAVKLTRDQVMKAGKLNDCTSGEFIRMKILEGKLETKAIAGAVRKAFKASKATIADVYWNRNYLKNAGIKLAS